MSSTSANSLRRGFFAALLGVAAVAHAQDEPLVGGFKLSEFPAAGGAPAFRLVSAGAEPRQALRYRLAAGSAHKLVMTLRMSVGMELDGRDAPVQRAPSMRMILDARVAEADEREARFDFNVAEPIELFETENAPPAMIEGMRKRLEQLSSLRGHVAMTSRGVVKEAGVEVAPGLDPEAAQVLQTMQQSMEQLSVPLPEEAVGVDAQWKMLQRVQGAGITLYQVAVFKVVRFEGTVATLAVTMEQYAPRQSMPLPGNAKGARAELISIKGQAEGHTAVDLTSPVPRSSFAMDSTMLMNIQGPDRTLQMGIRNRMQVQVEPGTP